MQTATPHVAQAHFEGIAVLEDAQHTQTALVLSRQWLSALEERIGDLHKTGKYNYSHQPASIIKKLFNQQSMWGSQARQWHHTWTGTGRASAGHLEPSSQKP